MQNSGAKRLNFRLNCTQFPALYCLSERILPLQCSQYHSWVNSWKNCTDWKPARRILAVTEHMLIATPNEGLYYFLPLYRRNWHTTVTEHVDSYTKWRAVLFSAYLQKELAHDICVDFKSAADMKCKQSPSTRWGKYFNVQNSVAFMNE